MNQTASIRSLFEDKLYSIVTIHGKCAVFIYEEIPNYDNVMTMRKELIGKYSETFINDGIKVQKICSSEVYHEVQKVCSAYTEVVEALEQINEKNEGNIIFCEKVKIRDKIPELPKSIMEQFTDAIKQREKEAIIDYVQQLSHYIEVNAQSVPVKRDLRYQIIKKVFAFIPKDEVEDSIMDRLMQSLYESQKEFEMQLLKVIALNYRNSKLDFDEIINYLEKNYNRYDLSLEEVAEFSGFTKTYLSKLFKIKTGTCYIDYLTELRMNRAKELLTETDKTIKTIVAEVGYIDVSTFRRKFKAKFKYGPAEYRELEK